MSNICYNYTITYNTNCLIHHENSDVDIRYDHQLGHTTPNNPMTPNAIVGIKNIIHQAIR